MKNCDKLLSYTAVTTKIPQHFRQDTYKKNGSNCMWLSAAMLVSRFNSDHGYQMANRLNEFNNIEKFEYMMLSRRSKSQLQYIDQDSLPEPLGYYLQEFGYQLKKVQKNENNNKRSCYVKHLLDKNTKGLYICQLTTYSNEKTHIVGIDCDEKLIYDCMERYYLKLSKDTLDYCCGINNLGLREITTCRRVIQQPAKKNKKQLVEK